MNVIALYNLKGGVGKTAAAVNLSYLAASHGYRTLIWDLDAQAAASFYFRVKPRIAGGAARLLHKKAALTKAIRATDYDSLDLVPADFSYRDLDLELGDRKKSSLRLRKLLKTVRQEYDLVFLDCAPSLSKVSENVFNMADWLVVPLIPTHLSLRAFEQLVKFRNRNGIHDGVLLPFFSMVDRRKRLHRELVRQFASDHAELLRSFVPYASQIERMGEHRAPVNAFADRSPGGRACHALWVALCERIGIAPRDPNDGKLP